MSEIQSQAKWFLGLRPPFNFSGSKENERAAQVNVLTDFTILSTRGNADDCLFVDGFVVR